MYKELINDAFKAVLSNKEQLTRSLLIPTILLIILNLFLEVKDNNMMLLVSTLLNGLVSIVISITIYRVIILGEDSIERWGHFKFGKRELKFIGANGAFFLIAIIVMAIVILLFATLKNDLLTTVAILALFIFFTIIYSRIILVFPSIATDYDLSFKTSWEYTKDYKSLTYIMTILAPALLAFVLWFVYSMVIAFLLMVFSDKLSFLTTILSIIITVFTTSLSAVNYMYIVKEVETRDREDELI